MTRWPTRAIFSLTAGPIAATTPHGSCPPMTGLGLTGRPPIDSPPDLGRRYWCRSLPHMPEAFISTTTSPGPGVGSGNSISSISRSPVKTTPRIGSSTFCRQISRSEPTPFRVRPVLPRSRETSHGPVEAGEEAACARVLRVFEELRGRTALDDDAVTHEGDELGDLMGKGDLMRDDDHCHSLPGELLDDPQHFADQLGVERGGDLVAQHDGGVHRQGTRDRDALALPTGEM